MTTSLRLFLVAVLTAALASAAPASAQDAGGAALPDAFAQSLETHGGLDTWEGYGTLSYTLTRTRGGTTQTDDQLVDLKARRVRITSDRYTLVHDGSDVGIAPGADALNYGPGPRFYSQTYFYFFAVPFVLADPGVNRESTGTETVDGTTYDVVRFTYDAGVGESPDDVYVGYFETDSGQLRMLRYSVTFGDIDRAEPNSVLVFTEWQEVDGLVVPESGTFHGWADGAPGEQVAEITYDDVDFETERPDDAMFAMPEGAEMDAAETDDDEMDG